MSAREAARSATIEMAIQWIGSIIAFALFLGFLYVVSHTGLTTRRGIELRKKLREARSQAGRQGQTVDVAKYNQMHSKATRMIILPIACWVVLYVAVFLFCPLGFALWSLLLLAAPVLGYFGIFFGP